MQDLAAATRFILRPTKAQKRAWFDAAYTAHAVCQCGHELGYHDAGRCTGTRACRCTEYRRAA